jgi:hypothetical protein
VSMERVIFYCIRSTLKAGVDDGQRHLLDRPVELVVTGGQLDKGIQKTFIDPGSCRQCIQLVGGKVHSITTSSN